MLPLFNNATLISLSIFLLLPIQHVCAADGDDAPVTTESLLNEMIDLERLGQFPRNAYETVQFSSYSRLASKPNGPGWFHNADGFGGESIPSVLEVIKKPDAKGVGTYLIAKGDGPGAVVRLWTASNNNGQLGMNGTIRMYLDGSEEPIFDGPAKEFLLRVYAGIAQKAGMSDEGLTKGFYQRDVGYFPIPFEKGCRIEWTGMINGVHFYHIEMRKYEAGTPVVSFSAKDLDKYRNKIKEVAQVLMHPSRRDAPRGKRHHFEKEVISAGARKAIFEVKEGGGEITELKLKLEAKNLDEALRQTELNIYFDGHSRPQVESPLGDFFGAAPGINPYDSIPMKVDADGTMTCRFVMPFRSSAVILVKNRSKHDVTVSGEAVVDSEAKWNNHSMHFYALWRVNHDMEITGRDGFDLPFVLANGKGRFVGCSVHLMNPSAHISGNWWGEGDEKIFVDDHPFPTFFGTGSEDYFNYSWSVPDIYANAYFAQPRCDGPDTRGFIVNNRWHILDDIPFEKRLHFFMEMIHHNSVEGFSYARISYLYGRPGIYTDQLPIFQDDLEIRPYPANWKPAVAGRHSKATIVEVENATGAEGLSVSNPFWADGKLALWEPSGEGDTLRLTFKVPKAGTYDFGIAMRISPDSGKCSIALNGKEREADLYSPFHTASRNFWIRKIDLVEGENTIILSCLGKNPKSKGHGIGADFLWFQP